MSAPLPLDRGRTLPDRPDMAGALSRPRRSGLRRAIEAARDAAVALARRIPESAIALLAASAEHLLPLLLLVGLGTRFAAPGLLVMTAVIQLLVYPGAWPTHGVWAAVLLWLVARGPGVVSLDQRLARRGEGAAR